VVNPLRRVRARYEPAATISGSRTAVSRRCTARARDERGTLRGSLVAAVGERFLVPAKTSPRSSLWISAHAVLTLPFLVAGSAWRYRADLAGTRVRVLCIGRDGQFRVLVGRLLDGEGQLESSSRRRMLWKPRRFWPTDADLVALDVHPWLAARFRAAGWLVCPEFVRWKGTLSRMPPSKPSKSLRSDLQRVAKGEYELERSTRSADWDEFERGMFIPYAVRRFEENAWIPSSGYLRALKGTGTLLFVRKDGQRVGGACVVRHDDEAWVAAIGVEDGNLALMQGGAVAAIYALTIEWARNHGMRRVDFGRTSAFQRDGIARFKRKWGMSPVPDPLSRLIAIRADPAQPAIRRAMEREPFLIETDGALRAYPG